MIFYQIFEGTALRMLIPKRHRRVIFQEKGVGSTGPEASKFKQERRPVWLNRTNSMRRIKAERRVKQLVHTASSVATEGLLR